MTGVSLETAWPWLISMATTVGLTLLRVGLVFVIGYVAVRFSRLGLQQLERVMVAASDAADQQSGTAQKRAATLTGILRTIALTAIWAIVIIEALQFVGLDVAPILAGAGILGLAVGFGAQNLVRDLISGFFIILEDQIRLGDVAVINGTGGLVETITFRTISLRDFSGVVHIFPNGAITTLSNMSKDWSAFVLDMGVAYKEDTDRVVAVMRAVGEELRQDRELGPLMLEPMEIVGVENFADSAVTIRARIKTRPLEQWKVGREYRRRLKKAFDAEGIEIPFPQRSLSILEAGHPLKVELVGGMGQAQG
ncbi:MAG: Small-conductance mechanosensitive channel [Nitrospirae bacterium]|nr:Small-conductance mechanosensitive channel [Nitrospirota bacterium]MCK6492392.1 mechanosensitive ion channel family protein [Nitrospira sp.]MEB2340083.1 mechanosensitive ion channel family protein [Nitrospirales bacterium]QOJ34130.1 MAG: mechanosensitive ion channel family protein [Nitrospira sp.]RIK56943.1 MAG: mechanosensitive ion channel protein MscS [Nitrospira sp.]